jgi:Chromo (CHRromatin Organisation MOdifier) domain
MADKLNHPPPPEIVGGERRYKIAEVMDSWLRYGRLEYLVRWKGYGHEENTWIVKKDLDAPNLVTTFYRTNPNTPKHISILAFRQMGFQPHY